ESGVSEAGFNTTVQPAANAGPILRVAITAGKFQGVTNTETPIDWCSTRIRFAPLGAIETEPMLRTASSENQRKNSAAYATSPRVSASVFPFSRTLRPASLSRSRIINSNVLRRISARSRGGRAAQG